MTECDTINVYDDLKLLHSLFLTLEVNDIDDQCFEYEAEQIHEITERILTVLEQHDETIHVFGELCNILMEVDNNE